MSAIEFALLVPAALAVGVALGHFIAGRFIKP